MTFKDDQSEAFFRIHKFRDAEVGLFHKIPRIDDSRLATIFAREVLADLVREELVIPE